MFLGDKNKGKSSLRSRKTPRGPRPTGTSTGTTTDRDFNRDYAQGSQSAPTLFLILRWLLGCEGEVKGLRYVGTSPDRPLRFLSGTERPRVVVDVLLRTQTGD